MNYKRPFSITIEDKRQRLINKIIKFGKENYAIGEIKTRKNYWNEKEEVGRRVVFSCPCCKYENSFFSTGWIFIDNDLHKDIGDEEIYDQIYWMLSHHIKQQIRLNGCERHMQLILDIFGEKDGLEILDIFCKKNILVAKAIQNFIQSKIKTEVKIT